MSIGYIIKKQKVVRNSKATTCYLAKVAYSNEADDEAIIRDVCSASTASEGDVLMMLREVRNAISRRLARSEKVRLRDLGTFYPAIKARSATTRNDATYRSISAARVVFRPAKSILNEMNNAGFHLVDQRVMLADTHPTGKQSTNGDDTTAES